MSSMTTAPVNLGCEIPGWLRGEDAQTICLIQIIEGIDDLGAETVRTVVSIACPTMPEREIETLICWVGAWLTTVERVESGSEPTSYHANAWEAEVEELRGKAVSDVVYALRHYGVQAVAA